MTTTNSTGLSVSKLKALSGVYLLSLSLSLLGSGSVVVVSIIKRKPLQEQAKLLFQLALADLLASAILMSTSILNFLSYDIISDAIILCMWGLPLSLTFYLISFLLVIIYACESTHTLQGWRESAGEGGEAQVQRRRRRFLCCYMIVWSLPMVGYLIYVTTLTLTEMDLLPSCETSNSDGECESVSARFCNSCILFLHIQKDACPDVDPEHNRFIQGFFMASVLSVLISCTFVYYKLGRWYRSYKATSMFPVEGDGFSRSRLKGIKSTARYMILVIIFCWTPVLVLVSLSFITHIKQDDLLPLYIIQALTVSLQGFLNSIVYAWRRRNFRDAVLGERMPLLHLSHQAFFDESLTGPPRP